MMCINYKNNIYIIKKSFGETENAFKERCWYIAKQSTENSTQNIQEIINASFLYSNPQCLYN